MVNNVNKQLVYSIKREEVHKVDSIYCEEIGNTSSKLIEHQDYEVYNDDNDQKTVFLKITKTLASQKQHHITIKVIDKDKIERDWLKLCQPKGQCVSRFCFVYKCLSIQLRFQTNMNQR